MPCDYKQYHPDWKWIRRQILDQADHRCEVCGLANGLRGYRESDGVFIPLDGEACDLRLICGQRRCFHIVLTIAHLDHDTLNNDPCNLRALCQQCHLRWDAEHHAKNAAETRRTKQTHAGQTSLLEMV